MVKPLGVVKTLKPPAPQNRYEWKNGKPIFSLKWKTGGGPRGAPCSQFPSLSILRPYMLYHFANFAIICQFCHCSPFICPAFFYHSYDSAPIAIATRVRGQLAPLYFPHEQAELVKRYNRMGRKIDKNGSGRPGGFPLNSYQLTDLAQLSIFRFPMRINFRPGGLNISYHLRALPVLPF